eukprot:7956548-Pyramimonas_sp.AAC.1
MSRANTSGTASCEEIKCKGVGTRRTAEAELCAQWGHEHQPAAECQGGRGQKVQQQRNARTRVN